MAWNTGSSSPGDLLMTCSTSEVAACCSSASASLFSSSARGSRVRPTRVLAFVPVERSLPPCVRLFAPLRDKATPGAAPSIGQALLATDILKHNTAGQVGEAIYGSATDGSRAS